MQIELKNIPSPGVLTTSAGYCFIEFDSHQLASVSFSLLSGATVNGKELKVGWALDSNDVRRRKQEYKWDKYHVQLVVCCDYSRTYAYKKKNRILRIYKK